MSGFWKSFRFWARDTFRSRDHAVKAPDDLARTIRDASQTGGAQGGSSVAATTKGLQQMAEGSEEYQKSFESRD
jgi:hypothetical protein